MTNIGFPIPAKENERRRALLPPDLRRTDRADRLIFEAGYGQALGIHDDEYRSAGAAVCDRKTVCQAPIICNPKPMNTDEYFGPDKTLFGWIHAVQGTAITDLLLSNTMTAVAWEDMFDAGRHCFWRNNEISAEAAIAHAFLQWGRLPYEARVAVIGRGNVARGAMRALERSGCNVTVYDRKTVHLLKHELRDLDVVVNCVLWDVFRTDRILCEQDLERMRPGGLIIDVSCDEAMEIETTRPTSINDPVYWHKGIMHYAVDHTPALYYHSASEAISKVVAGFIQELVDGTPGHVLEKATIVRSGEIIDERIRRFQNR